MDFFQLCNTRQSVRVYDSERCVEKETLQECIEAARLTPSACNSQSWHFTVCSGAAAKKIAGCVSDGVMNKWAFTVPVFIVVSEAPYNVTARAGSWIKRRDFRGGDIGAAALSFTLAAAERGLGTCILGWFKQRAVQKAVGSRRKVHLVIAAGYAPADYALRDKVRKPVSEICDWID